MISEHLTAAVSYLVAKASGKMAEHVGGEVGDRITKLWDAVKAKLTGKEMLADFVQNTEDADTQAALRVQLSKALEADPAFRAELTALIEEIKAHGGDRIIHKANVTGDRNVTTQVTGSGNVVR